MNKYSTSKGDYPYYSIIPHKFWKNKNIGKEVSIYGTVPFLSSSEDKKNWEIIQNGFTIRNNKHGYVGMFVGRFATIDEAANWIKCFFDKKQGFDSTSRRVDVVNKKIVIKVITGIHITSTEKKGFELLFREYLSKGIKSGRIGRTEYFIESTEDENIFSCETIKMETKIIGAVPSAQRNKFLLKVIVK